ncbi:PREDICTED: centromere protein K-like isoform X2 [Priapulus caudatus]|nr:PREDICTED: centromere protein K-like isoform X2 [Priapulus caudatus]XP_014670143.1 PREDICTED: centromere protein K-like isoform X2 [Priapulus caudatus]XP_014670151.1 PREDICTED: centromere protein K-like isoform X2 [Priapulus caudatus]XP_014670158.1 PREDICTED: centromere protein K-like isoform X2 [Priapulus caudatus]
MSGDAQNVANGPEASEDITHAIEDLRIDIDKQKALLQQLHSNVEKNFQCRAAGSRDSDPLVGIYQEQDAWLRGMIAAVQQRGDELLPTNHGACQEIVCRNLVETCKQLEEVLAHVKSQKQDLEEEKKRVEQWLLEDKEVGRELEKQIRLASDMENTSKKKIKAELGGKYKKAHEYHIFLMQKMIEFVSEHFAPPGAEKGKQKRHGIGALDTTGYAHLLPLYSFLEVLMNRCFEVPHDPYIQLSEEHWSEYVELLLRCGIVVRHPNDSNLIKLVAFHL